MAATEADFDRVTSVSSSARTDSSTLRATSTLRTQGLDSISENAVLETPSGSGPLASTCYQPEQLNRNTTKETEDDAQKAQEEERNMDLWTCIRQYKKAVAWAGLVSTSLILEGFALALTGGLFAMPQFKEMFGSAGHAGKEVPSLWQALLLNGPQVGSIIGLFLSGWFQKKFGLKAVMLAALALTCIFNFISFFAKGRGMLFAGFFLSGIPYGMFQSVTATYASEITPTVLRPYLTTWNNACWAIGQLIASGVLTGVLGIKGNLAWRLPLGLVWALPPFTGLAVFAPESPWWYVRNGKPKEAKTCLRQLRSRTPNEEDVVYEDNIRRTLALMVQTDEMEKLMPTGHFLDCFKGTNRRRTAISCFTWGAQVTCGSSIQPLSTYLFQQVGLSNNLAYIISIVMCCFGLIGTLLAWAMMARSWEKRKLYVFGLCSLAAILVGVGGTGIKPVQAARWATAILVLLYALIYNTFIGPIGYSLAAEMASTQQRGYTIVLARSFYNVLAIIANILVPPMLNPNGWNFQAKTGFFLAGLCALTATWAYFCLPETNRRTFGDLNTLFENKVSARKFATTNVDSLHANTGLELKTHSRGTTEMTMQSATGTMTDHMV